MKTLIIEIARIQKKKISDLMNEEPFLTPLDQIIFDRNYKINKESSHDCREICLCKDYECKTGCEKIICAKPDLIKQIFEV